MKTAPLLTNAMAQPQVPTWRRYLGSRYVPCTTYYSPSMQRRPTHGRDNFTATLKSKLTQLRQHLHQQQQLQVQGQQHQQQLLQQQHQQHR